MNKYNIKPPSVILPWKQSGPLPHNFDCNILPSPQKGFMLAVIGGRNTGKSVILYNLIKNYEGCYDSINIFSPTWEQDPTIGPESTGLDESSYFETIDEKFILELIEKQKIEKQKYDKKQNTTEFLSRHLLVFDDCITSEGFNSSSLSSILNILAFKGRHFRISVIITSQAYRALSRKLRINIPNFIITKTYNQTERKAICEELSNTMSERKFNELFEYAIEGEYNFFYIFMDAPDKKTCFRQNLTNILKYN